MGRISHDSINQFLERERFEDAYYMVMAFYLAASYPSYQFGMGYRILNFMKSPWGLKSEIFFDLIFP